MAKFSPITKACVAISAFLFGVSAGLSYFCYTEEAEQGLQFCMIALLPTFASCCYDLGYGASDIAGNHAELTENLI